MSAPQGGRIPVLALSAAAGTGDVDAAVAAGFDAHLAKPVDARLLASSVASLARGPSA
jgi:CheY-like chemotaxis protein